MQAVNGSDISYCYDLAQKEKRALNQISFTIHQGEFVAVLGLNGCGKSTLVKHLNALLKLQQGALTVLDMDVSLKQNNRELKKKCGMVFQNPDNQFVSSIVEEDISFGMNNYGIEKEEKKKRIKEVLHIVDMDGYEKRSIHTLSGGQKQRTALAGVLAMNPDILIFDEATSMLDPIGREEILDQMKQLNCNGKTIIMITHKVEEAVMADKILLMKQGKVLAIGTAHDILTNLSLMEEAKLMPPVPVRIFYDLKEKGIQLQNCPLTNEELVEELCQLH